MSLSPRQSKQDIKSGEMRVEFWKPSVENGEPRTQNREPRRSGLNWAKCLSLTFLAWKWLESGPKAGANGQME